MEAVVLKRYSSPPVILAVVLIAVGALVAACHDLEMDALSYAWALLSCCLNALNLTLMKGACNRAERAVQGAAGGGVVTEITLVNNLAPIPWLMLYLEVRILRSRARLRPGRHARHRKQDFLHGQLSRVNKLRGRCHRSERESSLLRAGQIQPFRPVSGVPCLESPMSAVASGTVHLWL